METQPPPGAPGAGTGIDPALFWHKRDEEMVPFQHFLTLQGFAVPRLDCSFYFVNAFLPQSAPPPWFLVNNIIFNNRSRAGPRVKAFGYFKPLLLISYLYETGIVATVWFFDPETRGSLRRPHHSQGGSRDWNPGPGHPRPTVCLRLQQKGPGCSLPSRLGAFMRVSIDCFVADLPSTGTGAGGRESTKPARLLPPSLSPRAAASVLSDPPTPAHPQTASQESCSPAPSSKDLGSYRASGVRALAHMCESVCLRERCRGRCLLLNSVSVTWDSCPLVNIGFHSSGKLLLTRHALRSPTRTHIHM